LSGELVVCEDPLALQFAEILAVVLTLGTIIGATESSLCSFASVSAVV
jgi:hypothetical protein